MSLDLSKLEEMKRRGSSIICRCPACAESGGDRNGNHLKIRDDGKFSCVIYPGEEGKAHRKRIYALAGIKDNTEEYANVPKKTFEVKKPALPPDHGKVIQKDILGRLGHIETTYAREVLESSLPKESDNTQKKCDVTVPAVPVSISERYKQTVPIQKEEQEEIDFNA